MHCLQGIWFTNRNLCAVDIMNAEQWTTVDRYFSELLAPTDATLDSILSANIEAGLPAHDVSQLQGKFLHLMALVQGAERILEIGTLGAYSTVWLARALPPAAGSLQLRPIQDTPRWRSPISPKLIWKLWRKCVSGRRWTCYRSFTQKRQDLST